MFHYGGVCFIMVGYVSLWWGRFHYGGVCFIVVGVVYCSIFGTPYMVVTHC